MKIIKSKFLCLIIQFVGIMQAFSAPHPPTPNAKKPPSPPGLSIDDNGLIIVTLTLLIGIYFIYKYTIKQKAPF